ncbi:putative protein phosphatase 2A, regulatory B subunit, B56 [Lupinus albus]|uniref:Uncharacterized protein n=1 Tax=Lupinus albus TaxID=3870 RepID=A0A6A4PAQ8_LUPAL|nr:putative protein phosphatase 2A, regulatory B subunit, B56 [Lupinus albus]
MFLVRAFLPLHKLKYVGVYQQYLSYCITQFVEKDFKLQESARRLKKAITFFLHILSCLLRQRPISYVLLLVLQTLVLQGFYSRALGEALKLCHYTFLLKTTNEALHH